MAHFAKLDNDNKVMSVIVVKNDAIKNDSGNEDEAVGIAFCKSLYGQDTKWVQTSYNNTFRKQFAGIDDT